MDEQREARLFDDDTGCLTDGGLRRLIAGSLEELERLEASEHLSYCDRCVERYAAMADSAPLLEAPDTMKQSILGALRRRAAKVFVDRYFHMAVAASLTLVLWGSGVFSSFGEARLVRRSEDFWQERDPRTSISWQLKDFAADVSDGVSELVDQLTTIDLRGAFKNEKK